MTSPTFTLRPAEESDRDRLYDLFVETMRDYVAATWDWDDAFQRRRFDTNFRPERSCVIEVAGSPIGVLTLEQRGDELYVIDLQITPTWQARGIGTALIRSLAAEAQDHHLTLTLSVLHTNHRARGLYESLGFTEVERSDALVKLALLPTQSPRR
jgi:ribosomal protein S18 acetylase RimI-like enzyme